MAFHSLSNFLWDFYLAYSGSPGQQCCYKDGELLMGPDSGGTVDRYAPTGNVGDFLLHQIP